MDSELESVALKCENLKHAFVYATAQQNRFDK